jgi:predicted acylesterase/phospholipase RssA
MMARIFLIVTVAAAFFFEGCNPHVLHPKPLEPHETSFSPIPNPDNLLIGVALSGGGSRAAYFGAAGLKAIAAIQSGEHSLLEQITHLSSVSGGSIAASYFAMFKPPRPVPVLQDNIISEEYQQFFAAYQHMMGINFKRGIIWRQFFKGRWFSSPRRAASLAEALDRTYLGQRTFADLYAREQRGDSPRLILNATLYNDGRRIAMTTLPSASFNYDIVALLEEEAKASSRAKELPEALRRAQQSLIPETFGDFAIDARQIPLSYAVAASASFPFLIGPISVARAASGETFLHVGDGGLFDNQGTESLVQFFLKELQENEEKRALVIAFDSSFPFWIRNTQFDELRNGFKIFFDDPGRIVGIMEQRANAYQAMVWHILQNNEILLPNQQRIIPTEQRIKVMVIRHTDEAIWPEDSVAIQYILPDSCRTIGKAFTSRKVLREHLAMIPTQFRLTSACDRDLLALAAQRGIQSKKKEISSFLNAK